MDVVKIMLDFLHGPIWTYGDEGIVTVDPEVIQKDKLVRQLSNEIEEMHNGYYEFDCNDQACFFDEEAEKRDKYIMLDLLTKLINRLNEINDGSYVIEDYVTEYYKNL